MNDEEKNRLKELIVRNTIYDMRSKYLEIRSISYKINGDILNIQFVFETESIIKKYTENDVINKMKSKFLELLKKHQYYDYFDETVQFEFHSEENIMKQYKKLDRSQVNIVRNVILEIRSWLSTMNISIYRIDQSPKDESLELHIIFDTNANLKEYTENGLIEKIKLKFLELFRNYKYFEHYSDIVNFKFSSSEEIEEDVEKIHEIGKKQTDLVEKVKSEIFIWLHNMNINVFDIFYVTCFGERLDVLVVFKTEKKLNEQIINGTTEKIKSKFLELLKEHNYYDKFGDVVAIEFDSDENVKKNYKNYGNRLR